jgi:DNA-binding GntR family transcriptional regulator
MDLRLVDDSSLADRVYAALENAIFAGQIVLGQRLLESELAEKLSVSRAPLREALRRLHFEGLAATVPRRGTYVIKPSRKDVIDLLQVREELEGLAARLAATSVADSELNRLSEGLQHIRKIISSNPNAGYPHEGVDFHQSVIQASGNGKVIQVMSGMYRQLRLVRLISGALAARGPRALQEHVAILKALKRRDPVLAEAAMRRHLRASAANILDTLKSEKD